MSNGSAFLRRRHQLTDLGTLTSGRRDPITLLTPDGAGNCTTNLLQVAVRDIGQVTDL
jgi:hypothetical protein